MASSPSSEGVETVDVGAAKSLVGSGHLYLDVRTIEEFNKGHPENALNSPYMFFTPQGRVMNPQFLEQVSSICSKDDFIVVVCGVYYASGFGRDRNCGIRDEYQPKVRELSAMPGKVLHHGFGLSKWSEISPCMCRSSKCWIQECKEHGRGLCCMG